VDVGLHQFAALSNGEFVENPRFFQKDEQALVKHNASSMRSSTSIAPKHVASQEGGRSCHERIRNRRQDFLHQTARRLVDQFGLLPSKPCRSRT